MIEKNTTRTMLLSTEYLSCLTGWVFLPYPAESQSTQKKQSEAPTAMTEEAATTPLLENEDVPEISLQRRRYKAVVQFLLQPLTDDKGTFSAIGSGLCTLTCAGVVLGSLSPKNHDLNGWWYPFVSAITGYTYFLMWSVSFYPQVFVNWRRRTTSGLSRDFCLLNVLGFACYAAYNLALFFNPTVRHEYQKRHGGSPVPVQSNDVAFALHALLLSTLTLLQILYYDGWQTPSKMIRIGVLVVILLIGGCGLLVATHQLHSLDLMYLLSYIKMGITLVKYTPQVILNCRRRSTAGWSIWQILLDFGGGTLSDAQLALDCANLQDWTGITGNLAKFTLGMVSIVFDIVFLIQHYILYPTNGDESGGHEEEAPLNQAEETEDDEEGPTQEPGESENSGEPPQVSAP